MAGNDPRRPFVAASLKMHLGHGETTRWLTDVARLVPHHVGADVVVLPSCTAITTARGILLGTPVAYGAQDCFWAATGAYTGAVSPAVLRELGCRYLEVGHAERRRIFHEDDAIVARKAAAAVANGMTPIICVGEDDRCGASGAAAHCVAQLDVVLAALPDREPAGLDVVVAYEPVWAIGARIPAQPDHIAAVAAAVRSRLDDSPHRGRIIYGGSAGPGLFERLRGVDGLFLGRSALDPGRFVATIKEVGRMAA